MLEVHDVSKGFHVGGARIQALDGVTMKVDPGEFVSIVGPSGSGKSTLLHLIGALDTPDSGTVKLDSEDIGVMTDRQRAELRRRRMGFIFQFFNLLPTMSAWENVAVPRLLDGQSLRSSKAKATELLTQLGLADRIDHRPSELSGGQMQRVAIARALIMDPHLLLADEPTGNLDTRTGAAILAFLAQVPAGAHGERAVVMVTHNPDAAAQTDRVITLQDGRVT
ncbi:ABC transporter ATP-binding protein [Mycobacterium sp. CPCC 205372]|uniref:ABC transporter ATP-binding protein n=1 Tax=Mycobacterium hippophais TaxID=3016340 RepID=A0ABT4PS46_9MYCO|nr:ABC transporter ATP-binding protein [Mycobacterium hippophais]MCZ8379366.1 ABC transporter ATP-binding protein [Mycobacterium hippophais]